MIETNIFIERDIYIIYMSVRIANETNATQQKLGRYLPNVERTNLLPEARANFIVQTVLARYPRLLSSSFPNRANDESFDFFWRIANLNRTAIMQIDGKLLLRRPVQRRRHIRTLETHSSSGTVLISRLKRELKLKLFGESRKKKSHGGNQF